MRMIQQQQQQYPLQNYQQQLAQYTKTQREDISNTQKPQKIRELSQIIKNDLVNQDKAPYNFANHALQTQEFSTQRKRSKTSFLKNFDLETAKSTTLDKQPQQQINNQNKKQFEQQKVDNNSTSSSRSHAITTFSGTSQQQPNNHNSYVDQDEFKKYRNLINNKTKTSKSQILQINTSSNQLPELENIGIIQDIKQERVQLQNNPLDQVKQNTIINDNKINSRMEIQTQKSVNNLKQVSYKNKNEFNINTDLECNQPKITRAKSQRDNIKFSSMNFQKGNLNPNNNDEDYTSQKLNQAQTSDRIQTLPEQNFQQEDDQFQYTFQEQDQILDQISQRQKLSKLQRNSCILDKHHSVQYQSQTHRQLTNNQHQVEDGDLMIINYQNNENQDLENTTYTNKTTNQDIINYNSNVNEFYFKYNSSNHQQKKSVERDSISSFQQNLNQQNIQNNQQQQNNIQIYNNKQIQEQNQAQQNQNISKKQNISNQQSNNQKNQTSLSSQTYSQIVEINEKQKELIKQQKEQIFSLSSHNNQLISQIQILERNNEIQIQTIQQLQVDIQTLEHDLQTSNQSKDLAILQHQKMFEQVQKLEQEVCQIQEQSSKFSSETHLIQQQQQSSKTQQNSIDLKNFTSQNNCSFDETSSPFSHNNFPSAKSIATTSTIVSQNSSTCIIKPQMQQCIQQNQHQHNEKLQNISDQIHQKINSYSQDQKTQFINSNILQNQNSKDQQVITAREGYSIFEQTFSQDDQHQSQDSKKLNRKIDFFENQLSLNGQKNQNNSNSAAFDILYQIFQKFGEGQVNQLDQLPEKIGYIIQENKSNTKFIKSMKELTMKCAPNNYFESSEPTLKIIWKFITRVMEEYTTLKSQNNQITKQNQKQCSNQIQKTSQSPINSKNNDKNIKNNIENNNFSNFCEINTGSQKIQ